MTRLSSMSRRRLALGSLLAVFFGAVLAGNAAAAIITIEGVSCVSATSSADGSGNVTITCGATVPGAPVLGTVTPGNAQATIAFSAGTGAAATSYTATCTDGTSLQSAMGAASPLIVASLINGNIYNCSVTASNAAGSSAPSAYLAVMPNSTGPTQATAPGAPGINAGGSSAGDTTVSVAYTAPASDGGSSIDSYRTTCTPSASAQSATSPILVSGLTNGTAYTCSVSAHNAVGWGPESGTVTLTPALATGATVPGAPTGVVAAPGNGSATLSFNPPANNGGRAIDYYTASCDSHAASGPASPLAVSELTNGQTYSCTVRAHNAIGFSAPSSPGASVTPSAPVAGSAPGTPTIGTAIAGNQSASVSFTPGTLGGGHSSYQALCTAVAPPANTFTGTGSASPVSVSGLSNGFSYTCQVRALNSFGSSAYSASSNQVTPTLGTPPTAPTTVSAAAGNGQITVTFSGQTQGTGTSPNYVANCSVAGGGAGVDVPGLSSPIVVGSLNNGTPYLCNVKVVTSVGTSAWSNNSNPATPSAPTAPTAPTIGTATAGNTSASVAFSAPASPGTLAGGAAASITGYTATCGGITGTGSGSPITVSGLTNDTPYTCTVKATNSAGLTGPDSQASNSVTPSGSACGPGEVFDTVAGDREWTPWNTVQLWPVPPVTGSGDTGRAIKFVADNSAYPLGVQLNIVDETQPSQPKEYFVSSCPHRFTPEGGVAACSIIGVGGTGETRLRFGSGSMQWYDCPLTPGNTYYINYRAYNVPRGTVSSQFLIYNRTDP